MSVRKRKWTTRSGEAKEAWVVDYTDNDGGRHIETFKRKKDADAHAQQVGIDTRAGTHTPVSKSITVAEAAENWIEGVRAEGREASTLAQYRQHAVHICDRIGKLKLATLTTPRLNAFRDSLLKADEGGKGPKPVSRALARMVLVSLKSMLRDAQRRGHVAQNVALAVKGIQRDKRDNAKLKIGVDIPTADEIRQIIAQLHGRWRPLMLTAIFTGLRASELRGLPWSNVDLKVGELHVTQRADRYHMIGNPKSEPGHRTVPLGPQVLNTLREWKLQCPKSELGLVFPTAHGRIDRHSNIVRALQLAVKQAGLMTDKDKNGRPKTDAEGRPKLAPKYTGLHALRHFYASWCINPVDRGGMGLPPKVVQERMGHSTLAMTMDVYGHLFPAGEDAAERLANAERALLG